MPIRLDFLQMKIDIVLVSHAQNLIRKYQADYDNTSVSVRPDTMPAVPKVEVITNRIRALRRKEQLISLFRLVGLLPLILRVKAWMRNTRIST